MNVRHVSSILGGIFVVLNLQSPAAMADSATSAAASAVPAPAPSTSADPKKLVALAELSLDREELDKALALFAQAAEMNYTPAQNKLGELADAEQDYELAVGWFLMAATQGDADGQYNLARMYAAGNGIEKDIGKALYWFRRSAAKNNLAASKMIADAYRDGILGLPVDPEQSKLWNAKVARLELIAKKEYADKQAEMAATRKRVAEEKAKKAEAAKAAKKSD